MYLVCKLSFKKYSCNRSYTAANGVNDLDLIPLFNGGRRVLRPWNHLAIKGHRNIGCVDGKLLHQLGHRVAGVDLSFFSIDGQFHPILQNKISSYKTDGLGVQLSRLKYGSDHSLKPEEMVSFYQGESHIFLYKEKTIRTLFL